MACHACGMPSTTMFETFVNAPQIASSPGQVKHAENLSTCSYSTQGELVCNLPKVPPKDTTVAGSGFMERFIRSSPR